MSNQKENAALVNAALNIAVLSVKYLSKTWKKRKIPFRLKDCMLYIKKTIIDITRF